MPDESSTPHGSDWPAEEIAAIATADDLHVAPERPEGGPRGGVPGTPTWIWSVVVDDALYVRPYRGPRSSWYQSAIETGTGLITSGGRTHRVTFAPADPDLRDRVDDAYRSKYVDSPYLPPMLATGPRTTTMRVTPAG